MSDQDHDLIVHTATELSRAWQSRDTVLHCARAFDQTTIELLSDVFASVGADVVGRMWVAGQSGDARAIEQAESHTSTNRGDPDNVVPATQALVARLDDNDLAEELAPSLNCGPELEALLSYLAAAGHRDTARYWEAAHIAGDDDPDDQHHDQYRAGTYRAVLDY